MAERDFDVVVVGGGHAGAEAAWAAARLGARTALVTLSARTIARMSCNPAIGGIGKGQIVREIDALGGLMGLAADATGIQFRMLNRSKGPAVWGPRCQSDRHAYAAFVRQALSGLENLTIIEGEAVEILTEGIGHSALGTGACATDRAAPQLPNAKCPMPAAPRQGVVGVKVVSTGVDGNELSLSCRAAIVTAGTFLRGLMHCGQETSSGGRYGEPPANHLSASLERLGIRLGRLKTGTCPRLAAESIDYSRLTRQDGDEPPAPFSFLNDALTVQQVPCWVTATNAATHQLIRDNLHRAPLFTGQITAGGPRYCPSLELKIVRFPDKDGHLVFLEPEGRQTRWVYLNGVSTSLPREVQEGVVRSIAGLERAEILRWGYAIEYDFADPVQLQATLQAKSVAGLFLAGQVNGTTGYEEAAGQGVLAGVNAVACLRRTEPLVLRRDQAYIGVMIDDLVTKGVLEPYRMFTSRAESRLALRSDNADRRLTPLGRAVGLVDRQRWEKFSAGQQAASAAGLLFDRLRIGGQSVAELLASPQWDVERVLSVLAAGESSPGQADLDDLARRLEELWRKDPLAVAGVAIDCRYAGYVAREQASLARLNELEGRRIPDGLDYATVSHLRAEARERLGAVRPRNLGQALRVSGITPADITVLMIHLARN